MRYVCNVFGHNWKYLIRVDSHKGRSVRICSHCGLTQKSNSKNMNNPKAKWIELTTKKDTKKNDITEE